MAVGRTAAPDDVFKIDKTICSLQWRVFHFIPHAYDLLTRDMYLPSTVIPAQCIHIQDHFAKDPMLYFLGVGWRLISVDNIFFDS